METITLSELQASPEYQTATPEQRALGELNVTTEAWVDQRDSHAFKFGSGEERQKIKDQFDLTHPLGKQVRVEEENVDNTFFENLTDTLGNSISTATRQAQLIPGILSGNLDEGDAELIMQGIQDQKLDFTPHNVRSLHKQITLHAKAIEKEKTIVGKSIRFAEALIKETLDNPKGVALFGADSFSSIFQSAIGTLAGAALPIPGGAIAGGIAGGASAELGPQFEDDVRAELKKRGLPENKESILSVLQDREFVDNAQGRSIRKSLTTAAVDTGLGLGTAKIISKPARKASKLIDATKKATAVALDPVGEVASEAAGQFAREKTLDPAVLETENLLDEALGSIGMGAIISTPANIKAVGGKLLPTDTQVKVVKRVGKKLVQSSAQPDFVNKVKEVAEGKIEAKEYTDITKPTYDPIVGVSGLKAKNQEESTTPVEKNNNYNEALEVVKVIDAKQQEAIAAEVKAVKEEGPKSEVAKLASARFDALSKLRTEVIILTNAMGKTGPTSPELKSKISEAKTTLGIKEAVTEVLGSSSIGLDTDLTNVIDNPKTYADTKQLAQDIQTLAESRKALTEQITPAPGEKTTQEVTENIFQGTGSQKGINNYISAIQNGDAATQKKELAGLQEFANRKQERATDFRAAMNGKPLPQGKYKQRNGKPAYVTPGFEPSVRAMELEAEALANAVILGSRIVNMKSNPVKTTGLVETSSNPTQNSLDRKSSTKVEDTKQESTLSKDDLAEILQTEVETKFKHISDEFLQLDKIENQTNIEEQRWIALEKKLDLLSNIEILASGGEITKKTVKDLELLVGKDFINKARAIRLQDSPDKERSTSSTAVVEPAAPSAQASNNLQPLSDSDPANQRVEDVSVDESTTPSTPKVEPKKETQNIEDTIKIPAKFVMGKAKSNFQKSVNAIKAVVNFLANKTKRVNPDARRVYGDIVKFNREFTKATSSIFNGEYEKFHPKYPIMQLTFGNDKEGYKLPERVIQAMAAVSYKWLVTRGSETLTNDEKDIRGLFGLTDDDIVIREAVRLLNDKGTPNGTLAEDLGKSILKLIGIKAATEAQAQEQERLEIALGLHALASMEKMGRVRRNVISRAEFDKLKEANNTLKFDYKITNDEDFLAKRGVDAESDLKYFVINSVKGKPTPENIKLKENYNRSKKTWDNIFSDSKDKTEYSWAPFAGGIDNFENADREILRKSGQMATLEQTKNKARNENRPVTLASRTMNIFSFLDQDSQRAVSGYVTPTNTHEDLITGVNSTNEQVDRNIEQVNSFVIDAKNQGSYEKEFYIPAWFGANGRMYQEGSINLQSSKIHRYLFSMKNWNTTVDSPALEKKFIEAVGQSLGIEASKKYSLQVALDATEDKLNNNPAIVEALEAIDEVLTIIGDVDTYQPIDAAKAAEMHPKLMAKIVAGVKEGGENIHTLKGLIEYQRYKLAKAAGVGFNTDLTLEIDGKANGPAIASLQLAISKLDERQLGVYMSEGLAFTIDVSEADHAVTHDPYEAIGAVWGNELALLEQDYIEIAKGMENKSLIAKQLRGYEQLQAAKILMGDLFNEKGTLTKVTRKLAKNRSVGALYGSGEPKIVLGLLYDVFIQNSIYERLQDIASNPETAVQEYNTLVKYVNLMADMVDEKEAFGIDPRLPDGSVDIKGILSTKVNEVVAEGLKTSIENFHGKALNKGIAAIYSDIQTARKPLNSAITMAVAYYNAAHEILLDTHTTKDTKISITQLRNMRSVLAQKSKKDATEAQKTALKKRKESIRERLDTELNEVTVGDLQAIRKKLRPLFPRVKTPMGGYIELAEFDRDKDYVKGNKLEVDQKYAKGSGVSRMRARPHNIGVLKNPGVKPVVTMIHMLDSMIANQIIGNKQDIGILNVHDGFIMGLEQSTDVSEIANEAFYKDMQRYSVAEEVINGRDATLKAFGKLIPASALRSQVIKDSFNNMGLLNQRQETPKQAYDLNNSEVYAVKDGGTITVRQELINGDVAYVPKTIVGTEHNKKAILDATPHVNQYYSAGGGHTTGNKQQTDIDGILVKDIIPNAMTGVATLAEKNVEIVNATSDTLASIRKTLQEPVIDEREYFGSKMSDVAEDPAEYKLVNELNSNNVIQTYDIIKDDSKSTVAPDSPAHDRKLKALLSDLVQNVMNPVDLYLKNNPEEETHGVLETGGESNQKLFLSSQVGIIGPVSSALATGIRMSTGEVYVHELIHAVTNAALNMNNPHARKLQRQVEVIYDLARKNLDYRAFLNDPTIDVNDKANQYEIEAAQERYDYIFRGKDSTKSRTYIDPVTKIKHIETKSNHLDEFIALGLTNENFGKALAGVSTVKYQQKVLAKSTWEGVFGGSIQDTIINIGQKIMDLINGMFRRVDYNAASDVGSELNRLAKLLVKIDSKNKTAIHNRISNIDAAYGKIADKGDQLIKQAFKSTPIVKSLTNLKKGLEVAANSRTGLGDLIRDIRYKYERLDYGIIKSVITEAKGYTARMSALHKLLLRRNVFLDAGKEAAIKAYKASAKGAFTKIELTPNDKVVITKVGLKTDLSDLLKHMNVFELHNYVDSPVALQQQIDRVVKDLKADPDLKDHTIFYNKSTSALGHFMIHGKFRANEDTVLSSKGIAALKGIDQEGSLTKNQITKAQTYVDHLGSLYALQNTAMKQRKEFAAIMEKDPEGVHAVLSLHNELKADALENAFGGNDYQMIKGYTKEILNPRIEYKLGTKADELEMKRQGFKMSERPISRDVSDPMKHIDMYAYTADTGRVNDFLSQILSLTSNKAKGADSYRLAEQMSLNTKVGKINNAKIMKAKRALRQSMYLPGSTPDIQGLNPMVAMVDPEGNTTNYRYMMDEVTKDTYLEKNNEFDDIMGAMAGQTIDKARSPIINTELVESLKIMYDAEYENNPGSYVEVGPHSEDPRLRERYYMMPAATRNAIMEFWGGDTMYVAKDVLTIAFGYRQYSIVEAFAKTPAERHLLEKIVVKLTNSIFSLFGIEGIKAANNIELVMQALTKLTKNNIVVRTLFITLENFGSNLHYLKLSGMNTMDILQYGWTALNQGLVYQADKQKLDRAEIDVKLLRDPAAVKRAEYKILRLKDKIARNPVTQAIESGMLPSIVDDVETDITQENFPSPLTQAIDKQVKKLPKPVVSVGKVLLPTQDTSAYKALNNAVKMTDFVARYALLQYKQEQALLPDNKAELTNAFSTEHGRLPTAKEFEDFVYTNSVIEVMEEFVNFDLPTHKSIEYLNKTGLVWFSKYAIRIQKVILNSAIKKPFRAISTYLLAAHMGLDNIGNSLIGVTKDLTDNMSNPVSMFIDSIDEVLPVTTIKSLFNK